MKFVKGLCLFLMLSGTSFAQDLVTTFVPDTMDVQVISRKNYVYRERTDLRRYDNGKYTGLTSREVRSFMAFEKETPEATFFNGNFYVLQKTLRNRTNVKDAINSAVPVNLSYAKDGSMKMDTESGYPTFRNFPVLPEQTVYPGDSWSSKGIRLADPYDSGEFIEMPMLVSYTFKKRSVWNGQDVYVVSATWATRFGPDDSCWGKLRGAAGSHNATLYISVDTGIMLLCQDQVNEEFILNDGRKVAYKGTISLFTDYAPAVDKASIEQALGVVAKSNVSDVPVNTSKFIGTGGAGGSGTSSTEKSGSSGGSKWINSDSIDYKETSSGIMLTLRNLQFESDSAVLLPGENERLDMIAAALKKAPGSMFLIGGHAASTGNPAGEQKVSEDRAKAIAQALIARGINPDMIMCRGYGSTVPQSTNDTPEGRAMNRRVEITILE